MHAIFDVKIDGRHKSCIVADGHLTVTPSELVYSGVVSLRGLQMCIFIGELGDIRNAHLEAVMSEKVCIRAGPEFEKL